MIKTLALFMAFYTTVYAAPATTASEQKKYVEDLSGVAQLGIGGLPSVISQRFSDSPEIFSAAQYLVQKYRDFGISASILEYNPLDAFPYYRQNTDETYRSYFKHLTPTLQQEFDGYCANTLTPEKRTVVENRLNRVGLVKDRFCQEPQNMRVEYYISATVDHTTALTKKMLDQRSLVTWPNVLAVVSESRSSLTDSGATVRPLCVIGAHLDSVARDGGGRGPIVSPNTLAPGADDNASGTAAVLTLARALKSWVESEGVNLPCDLAFAHFTGEEEGLLGSLVFAHLQVNRPVLWMANFDMVAFNGGEQPTVNIGYDSRFGRSLAEHFGESSPELRVIIVERETFIYSSDQISFWGIGVPAISISEQACSNVECSNPFKYFNPNLHTPHDTAEILDFDYAARIVNHSFGALKKVLSTYKSN
jgi:hypothetical protein